MDNIWPLGMDCSFGLHRMKMAIGDDSGVPMGGIVGRRTYDSI